MQPQNNKSLAELQRLTVPCSAVVRTVRPPWLRCARHLAVVLGGLYCLWTWPVFTPLAALAFVVLMLVDRLRGVRS